MGSQACRFCQDPESFQPFAPYFDAVYCLVLREYPRRAAALSDMLHELGLCARVIFLRARRAKHVGRAVWRNHQAIARHAIALGRRKVLILEDDAFFDVGRERVLAALRTATPKLPADWWGLYLGHFPLQAYPVGVGLFRARSGASHAYIASPSLLSWLAETEPMHPDVAICRTVGSSLDSAFTNLPNMYAVFPMVAIQRVFGEYLVNPNRDEKGRVRKWTDRLRYRNFVICHLMRPAEALSVLLSPIHWLTLEYVRRRSGAQFQREAQRLLAGENRFDEDFYTRAYPDVADSGRLPIEHFLVDGAPEGRLPNALARPISPRKRGVLSRLVEFLSK